MPRAATAPSVNGHVKDTPPPPKRTRKQDEGGTMITVAAPNFQYMECQIRGTSPLMIQRFSKKAELQKSHEEGSRKSRSKKDLKPRDFDADYEGAKYIDKTKKWEGFNAVSIRNAMIAACRTTGAKMTMMKLAIFVEAEGMDADGTPLIQIHGKPEKDIRPARNATGVIDLRARPRYDKWHARVVLRYDADMIGEEDVANLIMRAGMQAGIGEGRPFSKESAGIGYGLFEVMGRPVTRGKRS